MADAKNYVSKLKALVSEAKSSFAHSSNPAYMESRLRTKLNDMESVLRDLESALK